MFAIKKTPIKFIFYKFACILLLCSTSPIASTITPITESLLFTEGTEHTDDILVTAIKNSNSGISFNELTDFDVTKPLTIYNGVRTSDAEDYSDAADTIVIAANSVSLNSKIEIIGAPADLVIFSLSNKQISCNNCSFANAGRVTLAHATYSNDTSIGNIITKPEGSISIANLKAPGVLSLELIAENMYLSGTLDTNLKADIHPEGGMVINEQGAKIVGSGGVNIYSGRTTIDYQNLTIKSAINAGTLNFSGTINSASINITSPHNITISQSSKLNTLSDALSSGTRHGQFYAPLEGIFLNTIKNTNASINISGSLTTDNSISLKSHNNINLNPSSKIITKRIETLAQNIIVSQGLIQTTIAEIAANEYRNTGNIQARTVTVETIKNIFNSYGGIIKAQTVTLNSNNGTITNGSRTNRINYNLNGHLPLSVELTATRWGVKSDVDNAGSATGNLSAHILANDIYISGNALENINPYYINRPSDSAWNDGISVNNNASNRVTIQAENTLKIIAKNSAVNASALIGLNQNGVFHFNTPKFSNERYHLSVDTFKYTELTLRDDKSIHHDVVKTGDTTKVTSYSPPGRLYSFGEFKFNHISASQKAEFINEFSYFEVFKDLYFYKAIVKTIGLETGLRFQGANLQQIRSCIIYQNCINDVTTTSAESETLFSVRGSVYGIDSSVPSQSDLEVDNINVLEVQIQQAIEAFLAQFFQARTTDENGLTIYKYVSQSSVNGDILTATVLSCRDFELARDPGSSITTCSDEIITKSISSLIDDVSGNNEYKNTGYTYNELFDAIQSYIRTLPFTTTTTTFQIHHIINNLVGFDYDTSNRLFTVHYNERIGYNIPPFGIREYDVSVYITVQFSTIVPFIN